MEAIGLAAISLDIPLTILGPLFTSPNGTKLALGAGVAGPQAATPEEVITVPAAAAIGYFTGAITGGVGGSITAQTIEGQPSISWGRVAADTLLNLVPFGEVKRGPSYRSR